jgi:hypothetical protein
MMMETVASSETLVLVYQTTRRHIPEGLMFTSAAVRTSDLAFLRSRYKEKREGQVCVPVLTGRGRFVCRYLQGGAGLCSGTYRAGQVCVPVLTGRGRFVFRYLQGGAGLWSGTYRAGQVCVTVLTGRDRFVFGYLQGIILFVKGFGSW